MTTKITSLSEFIEVNTSSISITDCSSELIREIQEILKIDVDGIAGSITKQAFTDFKKDNQLEFPLVLGVTTAKELLELKDKEETASEVGDSINEQAGTRSGRTARLPNGETVYENQYIVEGIPLTWGEVTKSCTRIPVVGYRD